ncbi:predicted protein [Naegleria gruberi]|uniref:Predicted protein n=1 Tax=Naegleria gruberi TaxID=5762 RepID=D2VR48_NAEGR|nr:uncharacterized protein NAEGRDRAFT_71460 [Naegleria gruberi]EFC40831.1 predicted protein [Naegleria gruberi]|eukprot:XP_002673575.1 predicted protein [Naegleria gruberi strain NEG-M]
MKKSLALIRRAALSSQKQQVSAFRGVGATHIEPCLTQQVKVMNNIYQQSRFFSQHQIFSEAEQKQETPSATTPAYLASPNILDMVKPDMVKSDDMEEQNVYVSVQCYEDELERYEDTTDLIPNRQSITIEYDYPLSIPARKTFERPVNGFTQRQLVALICRGYKEIYEEEDGSSSITAQPMRDQDPNCSLINRCSTNGKYGIWGHEIGDLMLHTLCYNSEHDIFTIEVDS